MRDKELNYETLALQTNSIFAKITVGKPVERIKFNLQSGNGMKWSEENFHGRGEGVDPDRIYSYDDSFEFRAGSYSGYGNWRRLLNKLREGDSFSELINFADNEGVIGSVVSKKLYNDFRQNEGHMRICSSNLLDGGDWIYLYLDWMKAFDMAKDNGAVEFH